MKSTVLSVTQLNTYIKSIIDGDSLLRSLYVVGEISNFTNHYRTGHFYLTLKDENCAVKAVMFASANRRLKFMPENGMKVIVRGRVSVFERDGQYQLYIDDMQPDGLGALNLAFEQLKNRLAQEGLFDERFKKPIPHRCTRIGVVTSATGAVIQDIRNVISRRYPLAEIILAPVQVQGASAAPQIAEAIERFNSGDYADVLIVGRGGGSLEDLWAFNEEIVARAVFKSRIPIISAVGHETDFTICDFVADLRAPTPSAAAELAVPDIREDIAFVQTVVYECEATLLQRVNDEKERLEMIKERLRYRSPSMLIDQKIQTVDTLMTSALLSVQRKLDAQTARLSSTAARLDALSPLKVMARGYSIVTKDEKVVASSKDLTKGDRITVGFSDGERNCEVL
ncbi:MAG: exodeoxyribonuclease VII large subunit [Acutalibacteraceae bacterium]